MLSRDRKLRSVEDGQVHKVELELSPLGNEYRVRLGESGEEATVVRSGDGESGIWSILTSGGRSFEATVVREDTGVTVQVANSRFRFVLDVAFGRESVRSSASTRIEVRSPMPGKVVRVLVTAGQAVVAGEPILLFEAMKMQNELRSPQDGIVTQVAVAAGQSVEARELLYILDPPRV